MKFSEWVLCILKALLATVFASVLLLVMGYIVLGILSVALASVFDESLSDKIVLFVMIGIFVGVFIYNLYDSHKDLFNEKLKNEREAISAKESDLKNRENSLIGELEKREEKLKNDALRLDKDKILTKMYLDQKKDEVLTLLASKSPFKDSAKMVSELELYTFRDSENYLRNKRRPARAAADEVKAMRGVLRKALKQSKEIEYKYDYLLNSFPEIKNYIEDDQDLLSLSEYASYKDVESVRDKRQDYLSLEEYNRLNEIQKSQLALDRYVARQKTAWQIGRDYEMSCAFQLEREGYIVQMHGIKYGLHDLGRDLIARRGIGGLFGKEVLVIQCKNWRKERTLHENVIMQLYGTAVAYAVELNKQLNTEIVAVLMIPPYTVISETAQSFADKLKVRIIRKENNDFPRIKCNINNGVKIYHLPFDQQYDRTEIKLKGECYARTVQEAEDMGFKRAKRHNF